MQENFFVKSHGLGNDYIVLNSTNIEFSLTPQAIQTICDVHYGIGSDGILLKVVSNRADFGLKIYNPDGSEAEKSGNGLRIFCKYLYDYDFTKSKTFTVDTLGGVVSVEIIETENNKASIIRIDMGKAIFETDKIPVSHKDSTCFNVPLQLADGKTFHVNCVSVGNPHCVIITDKLDKDEVLKYGHLIETNPLFPNKINVQFARKIDKNNVEILIWERGAGYTLASGSSSCAVASVMCKLGLIQNNCIIKMEGGDLSILIDQDWNIKMTGPVRQIAEGYLSEELINELKK